MGRWLTITRATVDAGSERGYLEKIGKEAASFRTRGDRLWVFRSESRPGEFVEFRESENSTALSVRNPSAELLSEVDLA